MRVHTFTVLVGVRVVNEKILGKDIEVRSKSLKTGVDARKKADRRNLFFSRGRDGKRVWVCVG